MIVGLALVAFAAVGGAVLLLTGDSSDDESTRQVTPTDPAAVPDSELTELLLKKEAGISVRYPPEWKLSERRGLITLTSPDSCIAIAVSAPGEAGEADALRRDSISALRRSFRRIQVDPQPKREVGGIRSTSDLIAVRSRSGASVVIRQSLGAGERFTYLTQLVLRDASCTVAAPEANAIMDSLDFTK